MTSLAAIASVMCFLVTAFPKINTYVSRYINSHESFEVLDAALETLPDDASVKSSTFFVPHLAQRHEIYEIKSENETDFVVLDMRPALVNEALPYKTEYMNQGYTCYNDVPGYVLILQNPNYNNE